MRTGAAAAILLLIGSAFGQDADEVKRLKARVELLEAQLEAAKLKVEKLERENARLAAGGGKEEKNGGQKYTERFNVSQEAEYVLDKVSRSGRTVTLDITATLTKSEKAKRSYLEVHALDADGTWHKPKVQTGDRGGVEVDLRGGEAVKFQIKFPLDEQVTRLKRVEVTSAIVGKVAIQFENVTVPK